MSIIEEALRRLQIKKQMQSDDYVEGQDSEADADGAGFNGLVVGQKPKRGRFLIWFTVIVSLLGAGLWVGIDSHQKNIAAEIKAANASITFERIQPVQAPVQAPEQAPAQPVKEQPAASVDPVAVDESSQTGQTTETGVQDMNAVKEVEPPASEVAADDVPAPVGEDDWIVGGWSAMEQEGTGAALGAWHDGFLALPAKSMILLINVFKEEKSAMRLLRKIGKGHSSFVVAGNFKGKDSFYVLAAPPENPFVEADLIADIISKDSIRGNFQEKLVARMSTKNVMTASSISPSIMALSSVKVLAPPSGPPVKEEPKIEKDVVVETVSADAEIPEASIEDRLIRARRLVDSGLYSEAIDELNPIIRQNPERWDVYLLAGTAYLGTGDLHSARRNLDIGLAINARQPQLWIQRAVVEQESGNHAKALGFLRESEKLAPDMAEVYLNIGYSNDSLGDIDEAAKAYRNFLNLTEGDRKFLPIRQQVLQRLVDLQ